MYGSLGRDSACDLHQHHPGVFELLAQIPVLLLQVDSLCLHVLQQLVEGEHHL